MHFYFDITLQFLIMKKDSKLDCYLLYKYTDFLFVYPASFAGKRFTSTEEVNTVLEQVWCNDVGDFRLVDWLEFAQHVLRSKYPKNEINKIRLTLTSNRGRGALTELIQVQVWFCPGDKLTHKNTQTSTQAHACRVTDTDPNSLDTNTHGSPRPRIKHTLLHKDINLTKTYL